VYYWHSNWTDVRIHWLFIFIAQADVIEEMVEHIEHIEAIGTV